MLFTPDSLEQPGRQRLQPVRCGPPPSAHLLEDRDDQHHEAQQQDVSKRLDSVA
ncbi:hypothetical protein [Streptomyces sp. ISL-43]|uniref:hypothetical protein n=1 Tax=Streptomyces sp. ISL-43 TaxID=2819183 RepID=UPI0035A8700F